MYMNQILRRVVAAAAVTTVLTMGAGASAQAAMVVGNASGGGAQGQGQSQSAQAQNQGQRQSQPAQSQSQSAQSQSQSQSQSAQSQSQGESQSAQSQSPGQGQSQGESQSQSAQTEGQSQSAQAQSTPPKADNEGKQPSATPVAGANRQGPKGDSPAEPGKGSKAQGPKVDKPVNANANENAADKSANGNGHTPVTVCHLLGNGDYIELTFDENALAAHVDNHDDIYPVPSGGCPSPVEAAGDDTERENGRVTVCHVLGNGSFNLLTFDDNALEAHLAHGDIYPAPADAADCGHAAGASGNGASGDVSPDGTSTTELKNVVEEVVESVQLFSPETEQAPTQEAQTEEIPTAEILGVEAVATEPTPKAEVLGVQAEKATANRAPVSLRPASGILPSTGAGEYGLILLTGGGLLAAGATLLLRRRLQGTR
jgi:DNA mismatch repair ATPase MutL